MGSYVPPAQPARITRPTGDKRYYALLDELADLHAKKGADYGTKRDFLQNLRGSEEYGIPAWIGAVLRANDKRQRILAFIENGNLENESLEDSLLDSAAYYGLALILYREWKQKQEVAKHFSNDDQSKLNEPPVRFAGMPVHRSDEQDH